MSSYNIDGCGCCQPLPCSGFCDAYSLSFKFIGTTDGPDSLRPCSTPCTISYEREVPFVPGTNGMFMQQYNRGWRPWDADGNPNIIASGSQECSSATGFFGSYDIFRFGCYSRNSFQFGISMSSPWPEASEGSWRGGVFYSASRGGYPGFPGNTCGNRTPTRENGMCTMIDGEEVCGEFVLYPQSYHAIGNLYGTWAPIMESDFYTDSCEDFCGKTYTSNSDTMRTYTSKAEITFNCLP